MNADVPMLNEALEHTLSSLLRIARDAGRNEREIEAALDEEDPRGALVRVLASPSAPDDLPEVCSAQSDEASSPALMAHAPLHEDAPPQLVVHLRSAVAQLHQLLFQLRFQAEVVAPVVVERCRKIAALVAEECVRLARYSKEASIAFSSYAHRSLHACLLQMRRQVSDAIRQASERMLRSQALQLRSAEEHAWLRSTPSCESPLLVQLQRLPRCALVAAAFMSLRLASVLNIIVDAVIHELLHGRAAISKLGFIASLAVGSLSFYHYRQDLSYDLSTSSEESKVGTLWRHSVLVQLAKNLQRMPPLFWFATCTSGAVVLQASREFCLTVVESVLRMSSRRAVMATVLTGTVFRSSVMDNIDRVAPQASAALNTSWYQCQVFTRLVFAKLFPPRPPRIEAGAVRSKAFPDHVVGKVASTQENTRARDEGRVEADSNCRNGPIFQGGDEA